MADLFEVLPDQIWAQERNLWFGGVRLRSRTTIVRTSSGGLWVHSPTSPSDDVCLALDKLGEVQWIVVPNRFHHLNAAAMKRRYPEAKLIAPASVRAENVTSLVDRDISDPLLEAELPDFQILPLDGVPFLNETTFFHRPSRSLIAADLMMCGCSKDHWTWRWTARICGQYDRYKVPPDVRLRTRRGAELKRSLLALQSLPLARVLVAHSDPIEDRPAEQIASAWRFVDG